MRSWNAFFYRPWPAESLARFRIAFYVAALLHSIYHRFLGYFEYPAYLFQPVGLFRLVPLPQPDRAVMLALYVALWLLLGLAAAGSGRAVRILLVFLAFYVYGVRYNYGFNYKAETGVFLCFVVMAASRCDDALSWRRRHPPSDLDIARLHGYYSWPIQFTRAYWAFLMCTAGLFKLARTGWEWAGGDAIHQVLLRQMYYFYPQAHPPTPLAAFLLSHPFLTQWGSWLSLLVELAAPLVLLGGIYRWIILGNLVAMLTVVRFTMHHSFVIAHMPLYLSLLSWESSQATLMPEDGVAAVHGEDLAIDGGPQSDEMLDGQRHLLPGQQPAER